MRIVIIGGGFAGLSALHELYGRSRGELLLIDRKDTFDFLPAVPDIIGRGVRPSSVSAGLERICAGHGARFLKAKVAGVDFPRRTVLADSHQVPYDYLLLASGAETNFFGNKEAQEHGFTLYTVDDARRLLAALREREFDSCVVSGGGYTGVEAATCLRRYFKRRGLKKRIILVEITPSVLGTLPQWMREYAAKNLARLDVEVRTQTTVRGSAGGGVELSDGTRLDRCLLIWSAGMKTPEFTRSLPGEKNRQGRITVDSFLRFAPQAFAAGDAALFTDKGVPLRMAVQFSIVQGQAAARNILGSIRGKDLSPYKPVDLGYIIPMANNRSCGLLFSSLKVTGRVATLLHYLMCIYRSYGWRNKAAFASDLLR